MLAQVTTPSVTLPSLTIPSIVVALIIATICGAIAQLVVGYTRGGCLGSILVGLIGALLGNYIASWLHMPWILVIAGIDVVWTLIGSAIFVALLSLFFGGSRFGGYYRRYY